ncbi:Cytochrome P450 81E8 [Linum grandiflorum]
MRDFPSRNLPPSPPSLPIIGHLHLLADQSPHRSLHGLSSTYGGVILLRFGSRKVLVISSPHAVEECFTTNDVAFADRPQLLGGRHLNYNHTTIRACNYCDRWRNLRRLTTLELFSSSRVAAYSDSRREEAGLLLKELLLQEKGGMVSNLSWRFRGFAFNTILRMVVGKRYFGYGKSDSVGEEANEFQYLIFEFVGIQGTSAPNDFFSILRWFDFQGLEKRTKRIMTKLDSFLQHLVDEFRE